MRSKLQRGLEVIKVHEQAWVLNMQSINKIFLDFGIEWVHIAQEINRKGLKKGQEERIVFME